MRKIWYVVSKSELNFRKFLEIFDLEIQNARRVTESVHLMGLKTGTPIVFVQYDTTWAESIDIERLVKQRQFKVILVNF